MHRRTRLVATAAAVAMATGGLLAGSAAATEPPSRRSAGPAAGRAGAAADLTADLVWGECPTPTAGLQCTTLEVPLDYRDPGGRMLEIAVSRLPAGDPGQRRGVLLLNPGGPGGAGLDLPVLLAQAGLPASVLDQYDLIGFDPRGVGRSTPVSCGFTPEQQVAFLPAHAEDAEDVAARMPVMEELVDQCLAANPEDYLPHFTTANTARDMDRIRQALGEEEISYLGYSYGSYLGAVYAQLFPEHTDRVILDSAVGPEWVWRTEFRAWGPAGELAFPDFAKWAAERHGTYELGRTPEQVRRTYFELAGRLDETPIGPYDGTLFRWLTFGALYGEAQYAGLAQFWQAVDRADPEAAAVALARAGFDPAGPGRAAAQEAAVQEAAQVPADNFRSIQMTVLCADARWPVELEHYQKAVKRDGKRFPLFGAMTGNMWTCAAWPSDPVEPPVEITEEAASSGVLILQNLRDPATIVTGAVQLRKALGDQATLVLADEGGHGVYLFGDNACASNIATRYLVHGELPDEDEFCADGPAPRLSERAGGEDRDEALRELHSRQRPL